MKTRVKRLIKKRRKVEKDSNLQLLLKNGRGKQSYTKRTEKSKKIPIELNERRPPSLFLSNNAILDRSHIPHTYTRTTTPVKPLHRARLRVLRENYPPLFVHLFVSAPFGHRHRPNSNCGKTLEDNHPLPTPFKQENHRSRGLGKGPPEPLKIPVTATHTHTPTTS